MSEPAEAAWGRVLTLAGKLIEATDQLDDAGGLHRLARTWRPVVREKARALLAETRKSIEGAQAQMKDKPGPPRQPCPRVRRSLRGTITGVSISEIRRDRAASEQANKPRIGPFFMGGCDVRA